MEHERFVEMSWAADEQQQEDDKIIIIEEIGGDTWSFSGRSTSSSSSSSSRNSHHNHQHNSSTGAHKKKDPTSHRIIEKRRRDRMNNCLGSLCKLIPSKYFKKGPGRVEKTEIVETAIQYMKDLMTEYCSLLESASINQCTKPMTNEAPSSTISFNLSSNAGHQLLQSRPTSTRHDQPPRSPPSQDRSSDEEPDTCESLIQQMDCPTVGLDYGNENAPNSMEVDTSRRESDIGSNHSAYRNNSSSATNSAGWYKKAWLERSVSKTN